MIGIFALLTGCVIESHSAVATGVSLQGVALQDASGNRIEAQQALVDHSGNGQGREVHARLTVDGPEGEHKAEATETELTIDADRSEWNLADKIVVFEGNVRAERGTVHLQCRALEVSLDADGAIETALADGGVTVQQGQRTAKRNVPNQAIGPSQPRGQPTA